MGTTLTAFVLEGDTARFAHIGDSRAYLLRDGELRQVSDDHSLVGEMMRDGRLTEEEAAVHPHRSILSRALGTEPQARIDEFTEDLLPGDVLLLCSDGLSGPVPADAIRVALTRSDPQAAAERLILEARRGGGPDNITAVVVRLDEGPHGAAEDETTLVQRVGPGGRRRHRRAPVRRRRRRAVRRRRATPPTRWPPRRPRCAPTSRTLPPRPSRTSPPPPPAAAAAPCAASASSRRCWRCSRWRSPPAPSSSAPCSTSASTTARWPSTAACRARSARSRCTPCTGAASSTYDSLSPSARTLVDEQQLRDRESAMALSRMLGMWP